MVESKDAQIAVVVKCWPRLSETFIAQEMAGLEARGLKLVIYSLRLPTDPAIHPVHARVKAPIVYLPEYLKNDPLRVVRAWWKARKLPGYKAARARFLNFGQEGGVGSGGGQAGGFGIRFPGRRGAKLFDVGQ